jgi:hypothetical protein
MMRFFHKQDAAARFRQPVPAEPSATQQVLLKPQSRIRI